MSDPSANFSNDARTAWFPLNSITSSSGLFLRKSQAQYHFIYNYFGWDLKRWGLFLKSTCHLLDIITIIARTHTRIHVSNNSSLSVWAAVSLFISLRRKMPATLRKWSCGRAFSPLILKTCFWTLPEPPLKKFFLAVKNEPFRYLLCFHFRLHMASFPMAFD